MTKARSACCPDHPPEPGPVPCETACEALPRERPRYFLGRLLTARDLSSEQAYFLSRGRMHNQIFHGSGVICRLEVGPHPSELCRDEWVVVEPGLALDCCGREIIVCDRQSVPLPEPLPPPPDPATRTRTSIGGPGSSACAMPSA
jgi:hypothetical protein